jgi:hypothetical protein
MKVSKILWKTFVHVTAEPINTEMRDSLQLLVPFSQLRYRLSSEIITDRVEESAASSCPEDWGSRLLQNGGL